jgi:hypothetical protein
MRRDTRVARPASGMNLADRRMYRGKEAGRDWQVSA